MAATAACPRARRRSADRRAIEVAWWTDDDVVVPLQQGQCSPVGCNSRGRFSLAACNSASAAGIVQGPLPVSRGRALPTRWAYNQPRSGKPRFDSCSLPRFGRERSAKTIKGVFAAFPKRHMSIVAFSMGSVTANPPSISILGQLPITVSVRNKPYIRTVGSKRGKVPYQRLSQPVLRRLSTALGGLDQVSSGYRSRTIRDVHRNCTCRRLREIHTVRSTFVQSTLWAKRSELNLAAAG